VTRPAAAPVAVVTGAASGIGRAVASNLGQDGYRLCLVDRDAQRLREAAAELPGSAAFCADISDPDLCADVIAQVESDHGALDLLVLAAGVSCIGNVPAGDTRAWEHTLAVNTLGVMYCARAALPRMTQRQSGTIVVVASASSRVTYVGEPAYVASKHATVAFCDCLRKELVGSGVRICVVEPGLVDTPMSRAHPHIEDIVGSITPLQPSDIAGIVSFITRQPPNVAINEIVVRPASQEL
jgi:NADP-dependent 3-hydroxy acid dehydrogenase YdfG